MFDCQKVNIKQDPNFVAPLIPPKMGRLPNWYLGDFGADTTTHSGGSGWLGEQDLTALEIGCRYV